MNYVKRYEFHLRDKKELSHYIDKDSVDYKPEWITYNKSKDYNNLTKEIFIYYKDEYIKYIDEFKKKNVRETLKRNYILTLELLTTQDYDSISAKYNVKPMRITIIRKNTVFALYTWIASVKRNRIIKLEDFMTPEEEMFYIKDEP